MGTNGNRGNGKGIQFLREHVSYAGDDCLIWPMCRDGSNGYGRVGHEGKLCWAHRVMCELVNGPPPSPLHETAHSCGRGHDGCVHPKHLDWKTPQENQLDRHLHGTTGKPPLKLNAEQVTEIRALKGIKSQAQIAKDFGVTPQYVGSIHRGEVWQDRPRNFGRRISKSDRSVLVRRAGEMRKTNSTFDEVARVLNVSRGTARTFIREYRQTS